MGTNLQEVFDAFFIKLPGKSFVDKESEVYQYFKSGISKSKRKVYDNLDYSYDEELNEGCFNDIVSHSSIELISMYMVKEYYFGIFSLLSARKSFLGTQAFNKIPSAKEQFEETEKQMDRWDKEIAEQLADIPDYSDER